jgi:type VI secretion system protein ImpK
MSQHVERRAAPQPGSRNPSGSTPTSLVDIMYEGFYALFLLKNGNGPHEKTAFADHMTRFLGDVDRNAKALGVPADDVTAAKYAFCAAVDEIILRSDYEIREAWETRPLQLRLLLGFEGRFALDGKDKLAYLTARLGDEIARMRGKNRGFAPHAERPDQIAHKLGSDLSLWALAMVFAVAALGGYLGFRTALAHETDQALAGYNDLVKLPPRSANVTITLP